MGLSSDKLLDLWHSFVQTNDAEIFTVIVNDLHDDLYNYAKGKVKTAPHIDAQEIVQDALIKIYQGKYEIKKNVKGYFFSVINTISMDKLRRHKSTEELTALHHAIKTTEKPAATAEDKLKKADQLAKTCLSDEQYDFYGSYCKAVIAASVGGKTAYERLSEKHELTLPQVRKKKQTVTQKLIRCKQKSPTI